MIALVLDALLLLGVAIVTLGLLGLHRLPDVYTQLHAAGKAALLGVLAVLAAVATESWEMAARAALVGTFLVLATPVAAHAVARAAFLQGERLHGHDAVDESGRGLDRR